MTSFLLGATGAGRRRGAYPARRGRNQWRRGALGLVLLAGPAGLAGVLVRYRPRRLEVRGGSMRPTLEPGERVLALRLRVRPGDVVALRRPGEPDRVLLKRVAAVPGGAADLGEGVWVSAGAGYLVVGDNRPRSTDSRHFGPVDAGNVLGRAVYRYAPVERRGRLGVDMARDSRLG